MHAWSSGTKWMAPDNKFVWCPSGTYVLPNLNYVNAQGGFDPTKYLFTVEVVNVGGVKGIKYSDVVYGTNMRVMCEQP